MNKIFLPLIECARHPSLASTMSRHKDIDKRSWWQKHFDDHPNAASKAPDAFVPSSSGVSSARKLYCHACLPVDIEQSMMDDQNLIGQGRLNTARTRDQIIGDRELIIYTTSSYDETT